MALGINLFNGGEQGGAFISLGLGWGGVCVERFGFFETGSGFEHKKKEKMFCFFYFILFLTHESVIRKKIKIKRTLCKNKLRLSVFLPLLFYYYFFQCPSLGFALKL